MGDESAISLPWINIAWVTAVLPVTGALMLLLSVARLIALLSGQKITPGGHESWSGSSSE